MYQYTVKQVEKFFETREETTEYLSDRVTIKWTMEG